MSGFSDVVTARSAKPAIAFTVASEVGFFVSMRVPSADYNAIDFFTRRNVPASIAAIKRLDSRGRSVL
jgi:hypothetical protein